MMKRIYILIFISIGLISFSHNTSIDSLRTLLKTGKPDTNKINTLNLLAKEYIYISPDSTILFCNKAIELSRILQWEKKLSVSLKLIGNSYYFKGDYAESLKNYLKALEICNKANDKKGISGLLGNIGIIYFIRNDYSKTLEYYFKALKIDEELNNKSGIGIELGNIGLVYLNQNNFRQSMNYFQKAQKIYEELGLREDLALNLGNIGLVYHGQAQKELSEQRKDELLDKELECYFKAMKINEEGGNKFAIANVLGSIAGTYYIKKSYEEALEYSFKALKINQELENKESVTRNLGNIGSSYLGMNKLKEAEDFLLKSLQGNLFLKSLEGMKSNYEALSILYRKQNDFKHSLEYYKKFIAASDSIKNDETIKKQTRTEMNYEFEKKEEAARLEQEKKEAVAIAESKKQKIIIWSVCGILILVIGFAVFAYRSFLEKKRANVEITRQKKLIEEKQKEILDSIRYARRIQAALLPNEKYFARILEGQWKN